MECVLRRSASTIVNSRCRAATDGFTFTAPWRVRFPRVHRVPFERNCRTGAIRALRSLICSRAPPSTPTTSVSSTARVVPTSTIATTPPCASWADRGRRVFASQYSYTYLHDNGTFANSATWGGTQNSNGDSTTGILDTVSRQGQGVQRLARPRECSRRHLCPGYIHSTTRAATCGRSRAPANASCTRHGGPGWDSPVQIQPTVGDSAIRLQHAVAASAANICGRVVYSGFHVANASGNSIKCSRAMLDRPADSAGKSAGVHDLRLAACVSVGDPPPPPSCKPKTCTAAGATCGPVADGCGGLLNCGTCTPPASCGGGGVANQCGSVCKQTTCGAKGANCGIIAAGCGGTLTGGVCTAPAVCGGGGTANVCGVPQCQPRTCASVGARCGPISDGCGGTINCGTCVAPMTCGGGGTPTLAATALQPEDCAGESAECGFIGDGCGGTVGCGMCPNGQTCGAAGPNQCGGSCTPRTCTDAGADAASSATAAAAR